MRVTVRLFAVARQRAGSGEVVVDLNEPATVGDLRRALGESIPELAPLLSGFLLAVDSEYAPDSRPLTAGAEVAVIPPVSGGEASELATACRPNALRARPFDP